MNAEGRRERERREVADEGERVAGRRERGAKAEARGRRRRAGRRVSRMAEVSSPASESELPAFRE